MRLSGKRSTSLPGLVGNVIARQTWGRHSSLKTDEVADSAMSSGGAPSKTLRRSELTCSMISSTSSGARSSRRNGGESASGGVGSGGGESAEESRPHMLQTGTRRGDC